MFDFSADKYKEIHVLDKLLTEAEIPHTMKPSMGGWQICYPVESPNERLMDAVENTLSDSHEYNLLEIMGLLTPEGKNNMRVCSHLTATEVFGQIERHWINQTEEWRRHYKKLLQNNQNDLEQKEKNDVCDFCKKIYRSESLPDVYSYIACDVHFNRLEIYIDAEYDYGVIRDVRYCPYCGRDLNNGQAEE